MSKDWQQFEEGYNKRYTLVVRLRGPKRKPERPATAEAAAVPAYTFFEVSSSVYDMNTGNQIKASVASESVLTDDIEVAKSKGFAKAKSWASTSF
ncbi:hypothetical protein RBE51_13370 [Pseudomonas taiwanensis]|uniref:hypothetical protein n=1 Tax=Pseudomonas taiwanensis TaxID=470150 RepID=UPI0028DF89A5|nr:hypothetical protein [Pseudomonas taiwanensis]MDT8923804.1 hypothetical protein [Pseudomonas taiwanensis]